MANPTRPIQSRGESIQDELKHLLQDECSNRIAPSASIQTGPLPANFLDAGERYRFLWAAPLPTAKTVFFASSRLGQKPEQFPRWFDGLRTAASNLSNNDQTRPLLVSHPQVASHSFVKRAARLWRIPFVEFKELPSTVSDAFLDEVARQQASSAADEFDCYYRLLGDDRTSRDQPDELLASIAQEMYVLSVRRHGNVEKCIRRRAALGYDTRLLTDRTVCKPQLRDDLLDLGVYGWWLYDQDEPIHPTSQKRHLAPPLAPQAELSSIDTGDYLLHWTRRRVGQWPDQSVEQYLDDLIFGNSSSEHHAVAALGRILTMQRLIAANDLTRDERAVVSWSAVRMDQLRERRIFRAHLARWDFELYGLGIKRSVLLAQGARPVIYGDEGDWAPLNEADRPFFQLSNTDSTDWKSEQEWRTLGDFDLKQIRAEDAVVFVPTTQDANRLRPVSRWPLVVV